MDTKLSAWILFLLNPFITMIFALKDFTQPYAKNIFWAFCVFYGLVFAVGNESSNSDINRYTSELEQLHRIHPLDVDKAYKVFLDSGEVDVLRIIISTILSRITDNQGVLTMCYAFIFGYFYSRNIWYILELLNDKIHIGTKLLILALILVVPIWNINGFRMYTAFHIFMFGLLPYIFENKNNRFVFILMSALVHFSFLVPISVFLLYFFGLRKLELIFVLFVVSLFISEFNVNMMNSYIDAFVPEAIAERSEGYRSEIVIEGRNESLQVSTNNWYVRIYQMPLRWSFIAFMFYFYFIARKNLTNKAVFLRMFSITLLFFSAVNVLSYLPSVGRFYSIVYFLSLSMIILYSCYFKRDFYFMRLLYLLLPIIILYIIVSVRLGLYATSFTTLFGNPVVALFVAGDTLSLNDLIK